MKTVGRFDVRDAADTGEGYYGRALTISEILQDRAEESRLRRVITGKEKAGRDHKGEDEQLEAVAGRFMKRANTLILQSIVALDGEPVDLELSEDDQRAVLAALGRLTQDEWLKLLEGVMGGESVTKS